MYTEHRPSGAAALGSHRQHVTALVWDPCILSCSLHSSELSGSTERDPLHCQAKQRLLKSACVSEWDQRVGYTCAGPQQARGKLCLADKPASELGRLPYESPKGRQLPAPKPGVPAQHKSPMH